MKLFITRLLARYRAFVSLFKSKALPAVESKADSKADSKPEPFRMRSDAEIREDLMRVFNPEYFTKSYHVPGPLNKDEDIRQELLTMFSGMTHEQILNFFRPVTVRSPFEKSLQQTS